MFYFLLIFFSLYILSGYHQKNYKKVIVKDRQEQRSLSDSDKTAATVGRKQP